MQFLFPGFLWAFLLLSVPIIIHLFYFRRYKQVLFTNVRFLKELVEETSSKNKLKNLLILLARMLALAAIITAFAQPLFLDEQKIQASHQQVSIFIDNSWSMNATSTEGSLFQQAKKTAQDIIEAYNEHDRFQILTHQLEGKHLRMLSKEDALLALEDIVPGPAVQSLNHVYQKQVQVLKHVGNVGIVYQISDFQKSISAYESSAFDSSFLLHLIPIQSITENNIGIDSCYFTSPILVPGQVNQLVYKIHNYGSSDVEDLRMSYSVNGQDYPAQSISIAAGKIKEDTVFIKLSNVGWQKLTLKIQDFPVQFDDEYHMSFEVSAKVNVLLIYENKIPELIVQALKSLPYFTLSVQEYRALNYNSFQQNQLIILYQLPECSSGLVNELRKASEAKSNLLLFPPAQLMTGAYDNLYQSFRIPRLVNFETSRKEVSELNMEAELFNDVFSNAKANIRLPGSQGQYRLESQGVSEKILQYRDGQSMLIRTPMEFNFFYVFSCPFEPEYSDLSKSAEFTLPLFFKAALYHKNSTPYSYTIGNDPIIHWPLPKSDGKQELVIRLKGVEEFLPGVRRMGQELLIEIYDQVNKAGIYDLTNGEEVLGSVAFNDNRKESNLDVYTVQELKERYGNTVTIMDQSQSGDVAGRIREQQSGSQWWKFLLFFGIICLFVEGTLIRYWKSH